MIFATIHNRLMLTIIGLLALASACMRTVPGHDIHLPPARDVRRAPTTDYQSHVQQFRAAARTFQSREPVEIHEAPVQPARSVEPEPVRYHAARVFTIEPANVIEEEEEAAEEKISKITSDVCETCPDIWMNSNSSMEHLCSNHQSVSTFFSMSIDQQPAMHISDNSTITTCTRSITCTQPHMLVKWKDSDLCDVHAPTLDNATNVFTYMCNGTQWFIHGYPVESVVCAKSS